MVNFKNAIHCKVEKILKGSQDMIPSPSPENSNYGQYSLLEVYVKVKHCLITPSKLSRT